MKKILSLTLLLCFSLTIHSTFADEDYSTEEIVPTQEYSEPEPAPPVYDDEESIPQAQSELPVESPSEYEEY